MENLIHLKNVSSCWITKENYMKQVEQAYANWLIFMETMRRTKLHGIPDIDWSQLGRYSFAGAKYARNIQETWYDLESSNQWTPETYPNRRVYVRFRECVECLSFVYYLERYGPVPSPSVNPYFVAYQLVPFAGKSLVELQSRARLNYLSTIGNKYELARAINLSRLLGFKTFAVRSTLNGDVLAYIRSYL